MAHPFDYTPVHVHYVRHFTNGQWQKGTLTSSHDLTINPMSTSLQYGQQAFEGLKAYKGKDEHIRLFRVDQNAKRFNRSVSHLLMPTLPENEFIEAVEETIRANADYVPDYDSGGSLYIRPYMIGVGGQLPPAPSKDYLFGIVVMPVGQLFKRPLQPITLEITDYDRAAPNGSGSYKVGGNYAASMLAQMRAREKGYNDCLFLDPATHTSVEEVGVANFFGITEDNVYVTPESPSILRGITNLSLQHIASEELGLTVQRRTVKTQELKTFKEASACGTAAVITPIASIDGRSVSVHYHNPAQSGSITHRLYHRLKAIQYGDETGPPGWVRIINKG